jgi:CheY-like chemotaxis protein
MDDLGESVVFAGDLDDAWVAAIAGALPARTARVHCPGDLPANWPQGLGLARTLVVHRAILSETDAERLPRQRGRDVEGPRVVLCVGPHARYHQLVRWSPLVDVILPEATAAEVVGRHVIGAPARVRPAGPRPIVAVVSGLFELRRMLADACREAGYMAAAARAWEDVAAGGVALWDVPVLEPDWAEVLERESQVRRVIALVGFADRETVARARESGAAACLDLPCDVNDLAHVLDRVAAAPPRKADRPHGVPPAPVGFRVVRPEAADPGPGRPVADRRS